MKQCPVRMPWFISDSGQLMEYREALLVEYEAGRLTAEKFRRKIRLACKKYKNDVAELEATRQRRAANGGRFSWQDSKGGKVTKIVRRFRFRDGAPAGHRMTEIPRCNRARDAAPRPQPERQQLQQMSWATKLKALNLKLSAFWKERQP